MQTSSGLLTRKEKVVRQTFTLRIITELAKERKLVIFIAFLDLEKVSGVTAYLRYA